MHLSKQNITKTKIYKTANAARTHNAIQIEILDHLIEYRQID